MGDPSKPIRKWMRYPMKAPVFFWWKDENGKQLECEGTSRDISETGAFVFALNCPPVGVDVKFRIVVAAPFGVAGAVNMEFEGHVLRVNQTNTDGEKSGFAVLNHIPRSTGREESKVAVNPSGN